MKSDGGWDQASSAPSDLRVRNLMSLPISTFSAKSGGQTLFKALGHPLVRSMAAKLVRVLRGHGPIAIYDPLGIFETFAALNDISGIAIEAAYVQDVEHIGDLIGGVPAQPVSSLRTACFC